MSPLTVKLSSDSAGHLQRMQRQVSAALAKTIRKSVKRALKKGPVPDITWRNERMPVYPEGMALWQRIRCVLGYHKPEPRQTAHDHKCPGMKLRDQCGRCGALL